MKILANTSAVLVGFTVALLFDGATPALRADQLPNPRVTASARAYNASYTAANLFDPANAEYATLGQTAVSVPFTTTTTDGTWVELDFDTTVEFDRFVMRSRANAVDVIIQSRLIVSDDPTFDDSDRIFTFEPSGFNGAAFVQHFANTVSGRYVRWEVTSVAPGSVNVGANQMWFLKIPAGQALMPPPSAIYSSPPYNANYAAAFSLDDNFGTDYASLGAQGSMFIDFDFGDAKLISGFEFLNRWSDRVTTFDLLFSDNPDFAEILATQSFTASPDGNAVNSATFDPVTARYVRLQATGFEGAVNTGAREIQFFTPAGQPPVLTRIPADATRLVGDTLVLSSTAVGDLPLSFQWYHDGILIPDATNSALVLSNLTVGDSGAYEVVVDSSGGSTTSAPPAVVSVLDLPLDIESELRVWLPFDDGAGSLATDWSFNARDGSLSGFLDPDAAWVPGRIGGGLRVNPEGITDDDVVMVPHDDGLDFSGSLEFTLAAWVNGNPIQEDGAGIIAKGTGAGGEQFAMDTYLSRYRFYVRTASGAASVYHTSVSPNNTWQHLVAVFSAPLSRIKVYVNGTEVLNGTPPASLLQTFHELTIGSRQAGSGAYDLNFDGIVDDVRIFGRALTPADVTELYNQASLLSPTIVTQPVGGTFLAFEGVTLSAVADGSPPLSYQWLHDDVALPGATNATLRFTSLTVGDAGSYIVKVTNLRGVTNSEPAVITVEDPTPALEDGLLMHLKLDETSGTQALDSSGMDHHGTLQDFPEAPWTTGVVDGALAFNPDGGLGGDVVLVTDDPSLDFSSSLEFTLSAWVKGVSEQIPGAGIITKGAGNGGEQFSFDVYNGTYRFYGWVDPLTPAVFHTTISPDDTWQHLSAVCSASRGRILVYVNGVQILSGVPPAGLVANNHELTIGSRQAASGLYDLGFSGAIDDVRIYNRALTPREIKLLNQAGARPSLSITRSGQTVTVAWPTDVGSFQLESSDVLPGSTWTPVEGVVNNSITLTPQAAQRFYRLSR